MFNFGQRLRRLRDMRGMSQQKLADHLEVPQTTISFLENRPDLPKTELLQKFLDFFDVDISFFKEDTVETVDKQSEVDTYLAHLVEIKTGGRAAHLNNATVNEKALLDKFNKDDD